MNKVTSGTRGPIALITDFGLRDPYVAAIKGVILSIAPDACIVDVTHEVPPFSVREAAVALQAVVPFFPPGTVFVAVVDPGVGGKRKILLGRRDDRYFLAPDNGLLGFLEGAEFREVSNRKLFLRNVSATFHGRDIFAPVAARLVKGLAPSRVGPKLRSICRLPDGRPGRIVAIDHFGNLITDLPPGRAFVRIRGRRVPVVPTYSAAPRGALVAVVGSRGTLEVSVVQGSARRRLRARVGDPVR